MVNNFHEAGILVAAVQECRSKGIGGFEENGYDCFFSGLKKDGQSGAGHENIFAPRTLTRYTFAPFAPAPWEFQGVQFGFSYFFVFAYIFRCFIRRISKV